MEQKGQIVFRRVADEDPDPSYLEQEGFEDRLAAYGRGEFGYIGIYAATEVEIAGSLQEIRSPGLWGIESDSGEDYLSSIEQEELSVLRDILREMGCDE